MIKNFKYIFFLQVKQMGIFKDCGCGCNGGKAREKFLISMMSALIFFVVANPQTFILMRRLLGQWVAGPNGCPKFGGLLLHTVVFMLIVWGIMYLKKEAPPMKVKEVEVDANVVPVPMRDAPLPLPDMAEEQIELVDSGFELQGLDVTGSFDQVAGL
jgi:hypothetical protein|tara:strand:- start:2012 stop:2482 length:471 start_codon:yes stop_codon:yes gene_type:complete